jgi:uncharacterized protein YndB with AHSA1/START domain
MTVQTDNPAGSATSVSKSVEVAVPVATAYRVFTEQTSTWWPAEHHLISGPGLDVRLEPHVGGRITDVTDDGQECVWGRVTAWEPPGLFAFAWLIGPDWGVPHPDAPASQVTVTFTPLDERRTRVDLVHSGLDAHGDGWEGLLQGVGGEGGWGRILEGYAAAAAAAG